MSDIQGSTLILANAAGHSAATYDYSDYGETRQTSGSTSLYNPFLYTGQEYDFETSLYHLRARHYSPANGRFFSRDPIGYAGGSNMYAYCGADPVNFTDPSGLAWQLYTTRGSWSYSSVSGFLNSVTSVIKQGGLIQKIDFSGHGSSDLQGIADFDDQSKAGSIVTNFSTAVPTVDIVVRDDPDRPGEYRQDFVGLIKDHLAFGASLNFYGCG